MVLNSTVRSLRPESEQVAAGLRRRRNTPNGCRRCKSGAEMISQKCTLSQSWTDPRPALTGATGAAGAGFLKKLFPTPKSFDYPHTLPAHPERRVSGACPCILEGRRGKPSASHQIEACFIPAYGLFHSLKRRTLSQQSPREGSNGQILESYGKETGQKTRRA